MQETLDLTGKVLIAMPSMQDARFTHAVIYICAHSSDGAMGLVINKLADGVTLPALLEHLSIPVGEDAKTIPVHFGGPVEEGRGFVLHSDDYKSDISTHAVDHGIALTETLDVLEDLASGCGPERVVLALGYAGWSAGQLESELVENGWLVADGLPDLVFAADNGEKWRLALSQLGVDPLSLSLAGGHA